MEKQEITAPLPVKKHARMEWLDALRGFTMILVVAYHASTQGFSENIKTSSVLSFFVLFRMPLFFFISGFLAYKHDFVWTPRRLGSMVWKKVKIQMVPTLIFLYVSIVLLYPSFSKGFDRVMLSPTKGGYWFTWSLLHMFVVYYLFSYLESRLKWRSWVPVVSMWVMALVVYATLFMPAWFSYHKAPFFDYSSLTETLQYFHFFLFGNIVRRYWGSFQRLFDSKWFFPILLMVAFVSSVDYLKWIVCKMEWRNLPRTLSMYSLLLVVFMYFRHYSESFTRQTRVGRMLQYIGVRTLDIYLIHFLFMPNLKMVGSFLNANRHNFVIDATLSILFALLVIGFSLVVSNTLRISPFLKKWLFGRVDKRPLPAVDVTEDESEHEKYESINILK